MFCIVFVLDMRDTTAPQLQLEFKCFLVDRKTGKHVPVGLSFSVYVQINAPKFGCQFIFLVYWQF